MSDKDGGAAFPSPYVLPDNQGMSLRDYFAAEAIPVLVQYELTEGAWKHLCSESIALIADRAYDIADAMLYAKENKP